MLDQTAQKRRKIAIAVVASLIGLATVVPIAGALLTQFFSSDPPAASQASLTTTKPTPPPLTIKPLSVRPVQSVEGIVPDQCPPAAPTPPTEPLRTCDIGRNAVFTLGPEAVQLQLVKVSSVLSPVDKAYVVQMTMLPASAKAFGAFTGTQVGHQVALLRGGTVVLAPGIAAPITGETLALSGDLTAEKTDEVVRLLRDGPT